MQKCYRINLDEQHNPKGNQSKDISRQSTEQEIEISN